MTTAAPTAVMETSPAPGMHLKRSVRACVLAAEFNDFWDWLAIRRTCRECQSSLKYRSRLLDGSKLTFASLLDWDCDQLREFFFVSRYAGSVIWQLLPYAEENLALLSPSDGDDDRQNSEDILLGRNLVGKLPDAELVQQFRDDAINVSQSDRLCGGHLQSWRAHWYQGMWLTGRELIQTLLGSEAPASNGGVSGPRHEVASGASTDNVTVTGGEAIKAPYNWKTIIDFPEHLLEFLSALDRGGILRQLGGSGSLSVTRCYHKSRFMSRNMPEHVDVTSGEVGRKRTSNCIVNREKSKHFVNPRGKWARLLYCLVDTYASPSQSSCNAILLTDKRFVSLLSREFPVVALKLLAYRCVDGTWCRHVSRAHLYASLSKNSHKHMVFDPAIWPSRSEHTLIMRRFSFDCVCSLEMVKNKSSHERYRPVDVSDEMRELVKFVLCSTDRVHLNRQRRERDLQSSDAADSDGESSGSDDEGDLSDDEDSDELFGHKDQILSNKRERCRCAVDSWYFRVLSLRDSWESLDPPSSSRSTATIFEQRRWRRDALGFINRVCAEGPLDFDGTSELKTVILTPLLRLLESDWRDLALKFVQIYGDHLHPHVVELPSSIVLSTHYESPPPNARTVRRQIQSGERPFDWGEYELFAKKPLVPSNLESLDNFLAQLEDSDDGALKLFVQARGRAARQILAWKVQEQCRQAMHEISLKALEAVNIKLDAAPYEEIQKGLEDEFKAALRSCPISQNDGRCSHWRCTEWGWNPIDGYITGAQDISLQERVSREIKWHRQAASICQDYSRIYEMFGHILGCISCEGAEVEATLVTDISTSSASVQSLLSRESPITRRSKLNSTERFRRLVSDRGFHLVPALHHLGRHLFKTCDAFRDDIMFFTYQLDQGEVQVVDSESDDDWAS